MLSAVNSAMEVAKAANANGFGPLPASDPSQATFATSGENFGAQFRPGGVEQVGGVESLHGMSPISTRFTTPARSAEAVHGVLSKLGDLVGTRPQGVGFDTKSYSAASFELIELQMKVQERAFRGEMISKLAGSAAENTKTVLQTPT